MFSYELKRGTLTVYLSGELDQRMAAPIRSEIDALLDDAHIRRLVFDLRDLEFMEYNEEKNAYVAPNKYHLTVYSMQPDTTLKIAKQLTYNGTNLLDSRCYEFSCDKDSKITEEDIYSWVPDCIEEFGAYNDYKKDSNYP